MKTKNKKIKPNKSLFDHLHKNDSPYDYQCAVISSKIFDSHARNWWKENAPLVSESKFLELRAELN